MSATEPAAKKSRYLLTDWNPNDESKWDSKLAWRTLWITTYSLILAFCVWFLPSAIAPKLTLLGFNLDKSQLYWLTALPGLAAGILRLIYMFLPPLIGTRKLVGITSLLCIIPMLGWFFAVQDNTTPYWVLLTLAFMCGIGGGAFSGYMPSTGYFFPKRLVGTALGLQGGIGNLGMSVIQLVGPVLMGFGLFGMTWLAPQQQVAGDLLLGSQPGHAEQAEAHEDGANQLDDGHAEVTDATLQAEGRADEALGEEVAGGGHVAGERAAADSTHEGEGQQDPVGGRVVLDREEPAEHRNDAQQGGDAHELACADERGQEHVDEAQDAGGQTRKGGQPVELRLIQVEAEKRQLGRDRAGQEPHAEGQDQRVGRDPQRAPRELRVPLGFVVGVPVSEQVAALLGRGFGRAHGSPRV